METFLELECKGIGHEKINLGFILNTLEFSKKINFIADQSHIETLQRQLPESINKKINYYSIELPKKHYKILSIWHYFKIFKSLKSILKETDKIILLSFFSWNLIGLKLFLLFNPSRDKRFFFICHGVLEFLYDLKSFKRFKKYLKSKNIHVLLTKLSISLFSKGNFQFIFLSKHIEKNFRSKIGNTLNIDFRSMLIPYKFDEISKKGKVENLTFGTIGKGDLNATFKVLEKHPNLDFSIIRAIDTNRFTSFPNCKFFNQKNRLTREQIEEEIKKVDYLLYFYSEDSYTLSMSGALVDAINYLKPIIFLKNECISYYNNLYEIGIECKDLKDMLQKISSQKQLKMNYPILTENIEKLKNKFSQNDFNLLWNKT
jgi:hypothetical protein